jgi:hypothetical protein
MTESDQSIITNKKEINAFNILAAYLTKHNMQDELRQLTQIFNGFNGMKGFGAPAHSSVAVALPKVRGPRGSSTKKMAANAAAALAESEVVAMVREMKTAFTAEVAEVAEVATAVVAPEVVVEVAAEVVVEVAAEVVVEVVVEGAEDLVLTEESYQVSQVNDAVSNVDDLYDDLLDWIEEPIGQPTDSTDSVSFSAVMLAPTHVDAAHTVHADADDAAHATTNKRKKKPVFRHEFTPAIFEMLKEFTTATNHLDRKSHKKAWTEWVATHNDTIAQEIDRLKQAGYTGDALDKMFKTCRYYVSKRDKNSVDRKSRKGEAGAKLNSSETETDDATDTDELPDGETTKCANSSSTQKKPAVARAYVPIDKNVLQTMDEHIIMLVLNADDESTVPKPSECYAQFHTAFSEIIAAETARLARLHVGDDAEITTTAEDKLKKTYKNRLFAVQRAH